MASTHGALACISTLDADDVAQSDQAGAERAVRELLELLSLVTS